MSKPDLALRKDLNNKEYINLAIGEPVLVSINLKKVLKKYKISKHLLCESDIMAHEYKPSTGVPELVDLLKEKTGYDHIIVTNGAKQALSAAFYAIKTEGYDSVYFPVPYWVSLPTLAEKEGLRVETKAVNVDDMTAILLTSPNNPDGNTYSNSDLDKIWEDCKCDNVPLVFDGAYNSEVYLSNAELVGKKGTFNITSYSKSLGLSGLRVGYIATNSKKYADLLAEFVEITTTGVSSASQQIILRLEKLFKANPKIYADFVAACKVDFNLNRSKLKELNREIVDTKFISYNGMFAFLPKGPKCDEAFSKAKVKILPGDLFGKPGYVRIALGLEPKEFAKAVDLINVQV